MRPHLDDAGLLHHEPAWYVGRDGWFKVAVQAFFREHEDKVFRSDRTVGDARITVWGM